MRFSLSIVSSSLSGSGGGRAEGELLTEVSGEFIMKENPDAMFTIYNTYCGVAHYEIISISYIFHSTNVVCVFF